MKSKDLQSQMRDVALEYMRKVADLLGRDSRECHWVGTDDNECGIYTICDFGDITFLTLDQMQVIIDRLPDWLRRYGTTSSTGSWAAPAKGSALAMSSTASATPRHFRNLKK